MLDYQIIIRLDRIGVNQIRVIRTVIHQSCSFAHVSGLDGLRDTF